VIKYLIFILAIFSANISYANLYLQTEYQEGRKPKVITKQHIFLNKRYNVYYSLKSYVFILTKIEGNKATIESESYDVDKKGHKTMHGGALGTYAVGNSFTLTDNGPNGEKRFSLKVTLEKIVPTIP
jgi:hypothetical protein